MGPKGHRRGQASDQVRNNRRSDADARLRLPGLLLCLASLVATVGQAVALTGCSQAGVVTSLGVGNPTTGAELFAWGGLPESGLPERGGPEPRGPEEGSGGEGPRRGNRTQRVRAFAVSELELGWCHVAERNLPWDASRGSEGLIRRYLRAVGAFTLSVFGWCPECCLGSIRGCPTARTRPFAPRPTGRSRKHKGAKLPRTGGHGAPRRTVAGWVCGWIGSVGVGSLGDCLSGIAGRAVAFVLYPLLLTWQWTASWLPKEHADDLGGVVLIGIASATVWGLRLFNEYVVPPLADAAAHRAAPQLLLGLGVLGAAMGYAWGTGSRELGPDEGYEESWRERVPPRSEEGRHPVTEAEKARGQGHGRLRSAWVSPETRRRRAQSMRRKKRKERRVTEAGRRRSGRYRSAAHATRAAAYSTRKGLAERGRKQRMERNGRRKEQNDTNGSGKLSPKEGGQGSPGDDTSGREEDGPSGTDGVCIDPGAMVGALLGPEGSRGPAGRRGRKGCVAKRGLSLHRAWEVFKRIAPAGTTVPTLEEFASARFAGWGGQVSELIVKDSASETDTGDRPGGVTESAEHNPRKCRGRAPGEGKARTGNDQGAETDGTQEGESVVQQGGGANIGGATEGTGERPGGVTEGAEHNPRKCRGRAPGEGEARTGNDQRAETDGTQEGESCKDQRARWCRRFRVPNETLAQVGGAPRGPTGGEGAGEAKGGMGGADGSLVGSGEVTPARSSNIEVGSRYDMSCHDRSQQSEDEQAQGRLRKWMDEVGANGVGEGGDIIPQAPEPPHSPPLPPPLPPPPPPSPPLTAGATGEATCGDSSTAPSPTELVVDERTKGIRELAGQLYTHFLQPGPHCLRHMSWSGEVPAKEIAQWHCVKEVGAVWRTVEEAVESSDKFVLGGPPGARTVRLVPMNWDSLVRMPRSYFPEGLEGDGVFHCLEDMMVRGVLLDPDAPPRLTSDAHPRGATVVEPDGSCLWVALALLVLQWAQPNGEGLAPLVERYRNGRASSRGKNALFPGSYPGAPTSAQAEATGLVKDLAMALFERACECPAAEESLKHEGRLRLDYGVSPETMSLVMNELGIRVLMRVGPAELNCTVLLGKAGHIVGGMSYEVVYVPGSWGVEAKTVSHFAVDFMSRAGSEWGARWDAHHSSLSAPSPPVFGPDANEGGPPESVLVPGDATQAAAQTGFRPASTSDRRFGGSEGGSSQLGDGDGESVGSENSEDYEDSVAGPDPEEEADAAEPHPRPDLRVGLQVWIPAAVWPAHTPSDGQFFMGTLVEFGVWEGAPAWTVEFEGWSEAVWVQEEVIHTSPTPTLTRERAVQESKDQAGDGRSAESEGTPLNVSPVSRLAPPGRPAPSQDSTGSEYASSDDELSGALDPGSTEDTAIESCLGEIPRGWTEEVAPGAGELVHLEGEPVYLVGRLPCRRGGAPCIAIAATIGRVVEGGMIKIQVVRGEEVESVLVPSALVHHVRGEGIDSVSPRTEGPAIVGIFTRSKGDSTRWIRGGPGSGETSDSVGMFTSREGGFPSGFSWEDRPVPTAAGPAERRRAPGSPASLATETGELNEVIIIEHRGDRARVHDPESGMDRVVDANHLWDSTQGHGGGPRGTRETGGMDTARADERGGGRTERRGWATGGHPRSPPPLERPRPGDCGAPQPDRGRHLVDPPSGMVVDIAKALTRQSLESQRATLIASEKATWTAHGTTFKAAKLSPQDTPDRSWAAQLAMVIAVFGGSDLTTSADQYNCLIFDTVPRHNAGDVHRAGCERTSEPYYTATMYFLALNVRWGVSDRASSSAGLRLSMFLPRRATGPLKSGDWMAAVGIPESNPIATFVSVKEGIGKAAAGAEAWIATLRGSTQPERDIQDAVRRLGTFCKRVYGDKCPAFDEFASDVQEFLGEWRERDQNFTSLAAVVEAVEMALWEASARAGAWCRQDANAGPAPARRAAEDLRAEWTADFTGSGKRRDEAARALTPSMAVQKKRMFGDLKIAAAGALEALALAAVNGDGKMAGGHGPLGAFLAEELPSNIPQVPPQTQYECFTRIPHLPQQVKATAMVELAALSGQGGQACFAEWTMRGCRYAECPRCHGKVPPKIPVPPALKGKLLLETNAWLAARGGAVFVPPASRSHLLDFNGRQKAVEGFLSLIAARQSGKQAGTQGAGGGPCVIGGGGVIEGPQSPGGAASRPSAEAPNPVSGESPSLESDPESGYASAEDGAWSEAGDTFEVGGSASARLQKGVATLSWGEHHRHEAAARAGNATGEGLTDPIEVSQVAAKRMREHGLQASEARGLDRDLVGIHGDQPPPQVGSGTGRAVNSDGLSSPMKKAGDKIRRGSALWGAVGWSRDVPAPPDSDVELQHWVLSAASAYLCDAGSGPGALDRAFRAGVFDVWHNTSNREGRTGAGKLIEKHGLRDPRLVTRVGSVPGLGPDSANGATYGGLRVVDLGERISTGPGTFRKDACLVLAAAHGVGADAAQTVHSLVERATEYGAEGGPMAGEGITATEALMVEGAHDLTAQMPLYPHIFRFFWPSNWCPQAVLVTVERLDSGKLSWKVTLGPRADCAKPLRVAFVLLGYCHARALEPDPSVGADVPRYLRGRRESGDLVEVHRSRSWAETAKAARKAEVGGQGGLRQPGEVFARCKCAGACQAAAGCRDRRCVPGLGGVVAQDASMEFGLLEKMGHTPEGMGFVEGPQREGDPETVVRVEDLLSRAKSGEDLSEALRIYNDSDVAGRPSLALECTPERLIAVLELVLDQAQAMVEAAGGEFRFDSGTWQRAIARGNNALSECESPADLAVVHNAVLLYLGIGVMDPVGVERLASGCEKETPQTARYLRSLARSGMSMQVPDGCPGVRNRPMPSYANAKDKVREAVGDDYCHFAVVLCEPPRCGTAGEGLVSSPIGAVPKNEAGRPTGKFRVILGMQRLVNTLTSKFNFPRAALPKIYAPIRRYLLLRRLYPETVRIGCALRDIGRFFKRLRLDPDSTHLACLDIPDERDDAGNVFAGCTVVSLVAQFGFTGSPGAAIMVSQALDTTFGNFRPIDAVRDGPLNFACDTWCDDSVTANPIVGIRPELALEVLEALMRGIGDGAVSTKYRQPHSITTQYFWGLEWNFARDPPTVGMVAEKLETARLVLGQKCFNRGCTNVPMLTLQKLYGQLEHWCSVSRAGRTLLTCVSRLLCSPRESFLVLPTGTGREVDDKWNRFWTAVSILRKLVDENHGSAFTQDARNPAFGALTVQERLSYEGERQAAVFLGGDAIPGLVSFINHAEQTYALWPLSSEDRRIIRKLALLDPTPRLEEVETEDHVDNLIISIYELLCIYSAVCYYCTRDRDVWRGRLVVIITDNMNVKQWLESRKPKSPIAMHLISAIAAFELRGAFTIYATYASTHVNLVADSLTRIPKLDPNGGLTGLDELEVWLAEYGSKLRRIEIVSDVRATLRPLEEVYFPKNRGELTGQGAVTQGEGINSLSAEPREGAARGPRAPEAPAVPARSTVGTTGALGAQGSGQLVGGQCIIAEFAAGTGQMSSALARVAGGKVVAWWEKAPIQQFALRRRHPLAIARCDVRDQATFSPPLGVHVWAGGPPCNSACSANPKARGIDDRRALVLFEALKLVRRRDFASFRHLGSLRLGAPGGLRLRSTASALVQLEFVPNIFRVQEGLMWNGWLDWFEERRLVPQCFYMTAAAFGSATLRARLLVIAQPVEWFEELGNVLPPVVPQVNPGTLEACLEDPESMLPHLDIADMDSERFVPDLAADRGPYQQRRVGWFLRERTAPRLAVWSIHRPAFVVRAYGAGLWENGDFSLDAGPGSNFYADDRAGRGKVIALSHVACAAVQGVPMELFEGANVDCYVKRCYEAVGNAVPWELALAMASCTAVRVAEMEARENVYRVGGTRRVLCLCFVAWRKALCPPVRQKLRDDKFVVGAKVGGMARGPTELPGGAVGERAWDGSRVERAEPSEDEWVERAARVLREKGLTTISLTNGPGGTRARLGVTSRRQIKEEEPRRMGGGRKAAPSMVESHRLLRHVSHIMELAWAPSTRARYAGYWSQWEEFARVTSPGQGPVLRVADQAAETMLIKFALSEVVYHGNSWSTASNKLTAVRSYHLRHFNVDLSQGFHKLEALSRALGKEAARTKKKKRPVRLSMLRVIRSRLTLDFFEDALAWAAVSVAFFAMLRVGQYAGPRTKRTLRDADIQLMCGDEVIAWETCSDQDLARVTEVMASLRESKTDTCGDGDVRFLGATSGNLCPVKAICSLVRARRQFGIAFEPERPFLRRQAGGKPAVFAYGEVAKLLKAAAVLEGHDPQDYGTHSLRSGGASALYAAGVAFEVIKKLGGWRSDCVLGYTWENRETARQATQRMATALDASDQEALTLLRARRLAHHVGRTELQAILAM